MRQFFLATDPSRPPRAGDRVTLDPEETRHLRTVLRGGRDAELVLVDGRGLRMTARAAAGAGPDVLEILTVRTDPGETAPPRLVLACAMVKGRRFEWVLEKAVELGAHAVVPLRTERGVVEAGGGRRSRWESILKSALKQSGRATLPDLPPPAAPDEVLAGAAGEPVLYGAVPGEAAAVPWTDLLAEVPSATPASLTLLVGPEGGWSDGERTRLEAGGARPVGLGPHVLRTETAALVGLAALQALRRAWTRPGGA